MTLAVTYKGWRRFVDSGAWYLWWEVNKHLPDLGVKNGQWIFDQGPGRRHRLQLRSAKEGYIRDLSVKAFQAALFRLPPWDPPTSTAEAMREVMQSLEKGTAALTSALDRLTAAQQAKPAATKDDDPNKSEHPEVKENRFLRFKRVFRWSNTESPVRVWELLVDVPEITAQAGDELWEDDDFELRRKWKRIGDPEWWQVQHLFSPGMSWQESGDAPTGAGATAPTEDLSDPALRALRAMYPTRNLEEGVLIYQLALAATRPIEALGIREGDIVIRLWHSGAYYQQQDLSRTVGGRFIRLKRADLFLLADNRESLRLLDHSGRSRVSPLHDFYRYCRGGQRATWKDANCPVGILRPLRSPVSEPLEAANDAEALFELITGAGCKLLTENESTSSITTEG